MRFGLGDFDAVRRLIAKYASAPAQLLGLGAWLFVPSNASLAQMVETTLQLPAPTQNPLSIDPDTDPFFAFLNGGADPDAFNAMIQQAVDRAPSGAAARADLEVAEASRGEARAAFFPTVDLSVSSYRTLARDFSNDPLNIVERSRGKSRTDGVISANQLVFDFGATQQRLEAAQSRIDAAAAGKIDVAEQVSLQAISAFYRVLAYRLLVSLNDDNARQLVSIQADTQYRIGLGALARADATRVDAAVAQNEAERARFVRARDTAEFVFTNLVGDGAPSTMARPVLPDFSYSSSDAIRLLVAETASVKAAAAAAKGAYAEAKAAKADMLPTVSIGLDAGRYGLAENATDYDIRIRASLRQRLFGGLPQRYDRLSATARAADARARATFDDAERSALAAWQDEIGLDKQLVAQRDSYFAARKARDVQQERFRISRGNLFDVLDASRTYYQSAVDLLLVLLERDTARYTVLARTGKLLEALHVTTTNDQKEARFK
jgi:outer membrane protein, adhesin transport system